LDVLPIHVHQIARFQRGCIGHGLGRRFSVRFSGRE
jgi:hypothetical protein